ncbi:MAG: hypothetical protein ABSH08_07335 [Tepidisphaeraceae bacterium]
MQRRVWSLWIFVTFLLFFGALLARSIIIRVFSRSLRDTDTRVYSALNLRQIGQAICLYSRDNRGQYPDSFQTILLNEDITSAVFVSPARSETPANAPTTQATAAQMGAGGHVSYIYLGRGLSVNAVTPNTIVAYEMIPMPAGGQTCSLVMDTLSGSVPPRSGRSAAAPIRDSFR